MLKFLQNKDRNALQAEICGGSDDEVWTTQFVFGEKRARVIILIPF